MEFGIRIRLKSGVLWVRVPPGIPEINMKIKIGNNYYEADVGQPIMVILTDDDKMRINQMDVTSAKYAIFHEKDTMSVVEKEQWMDK